MYFTVEELKKGVWGEGTVVGRCCSARRWRWRPGTHWSLYCRHRGNGCEMTSALATHLPAVRQQFCARSCTHARCYILPPPTHSAFLRLKVAGAVPYAGRGLRGPGKYDRSAKRRHHRDRDKAGPALNTVLCGCSHFPPVAPPRAPMISPETPRSRTCLVPASSPRSPPRSGR